MTDCILWPKEMQELLAFAAVLAFDPVEDFKMPCMLVDGGWEYYTKLQLLIFFPMLFAFCMSVACFLLHMVKAHFRHQRDTEKKVLEKWAVRVIKRRRSSSATDGGDIDHDAIGRVARRASYKLKMRGSIKHALETCVSVVCMVLDLVFPVASRTILQIFRCRRLGDAGYYLEADYSLPVDRTPEH